MRDGPPDFRPFADGDVAQGLREEWTALRAAMPLETDWGPEELDDAFIATGLTEYEQKGDQGSSADTSQRAAATAGQHRWWCKRPCMHAQLRLSCCLTFPGFPANQPHADSE
eukprot:jgi/Ulvmu1/10552/UM065_0006.1